MAPPWFLKKFKHKLFFLDHVLIDPSNVASTSTKLDVIIDITQANENLTKARKGKKSMNWIDDSKIDGLHNVLGQKLLWVLMER